MTSKNFLNKKGKNCFGRSLFLGSGQSIRIKNLAMLIASHFSSAHLKLIHFGSIPSNKFDNVGYKFDHLKTILDNVSKIEKIGVCFDTQHGFASGFDIRTENGWNSTFDEFDKKIGLDNLKVFHVNDSKKECGSRVDRHASIGKGLLTMETFWCLVNDKRFTNLPMILETPDPTIYESEIKLLEQLKGSKKP